MIYRPFRPSFDTADVIWPESDLIRRRSLHAVDHEDFDRALVDSAGQAVPEAR